MWIHQAIDEEREEIGRLLVECGLPRTTHLDPYAKFLIVRSGRCLVGVGALSISGRVGVCHSVAVLPAFRSLGLGRTLGRSLMDLATEEDLQEIWLRTRGAVFFFRSLGFEPVPMDLQIPPEVAALGRLDGHSMGEVLRMPVMRATKCAG